MNKFSFLGVLIRLQETTFSVNEGENNLQVCVELVGSTQIPVSAILVPFDGSATSKNKFNLLISS